MPPHTRRLTAAGPPRPIHPPGRRPARVISSQLVAHDPCHLGPQALEERAMATTHAQRWVTFTGVLSIVAVYNILSGIAAIAEDDVTERVGEVCTASTSPPGAGSG